MTKERILIIAILIPFIVFTDIALFSINSLDELVSAFTSHLMVIQVVLDFIICFTLVSIWVWQHAKSQGVNPVPYMVALWLTGAIALLIYVYRHVLKKPGEKSTDERYQVSV